MKSLKQLQKDLGILHGKLEIIIEEDNRWFEQDHFYAEHSYQKYILMLSESGTSGTLAYGYLVPMPGCCGVVISTQAYVGFNHRNKGIGDWMHKYRVQKARELGYTVMLCTHTYDDYGAEYQNAILKRNKWKNLFSFKNKRTDNPVRLYRKLL